MQRCPTSPRFVSVWRRITRQRARRFHDWFINLCGWSELYNYLVVTVKTINSTPQSGMSKPAPHPSKKKKKKGVCRFSPTRRVAARAKVQSPYCTISCNPSTLTRKRLQPSWTQICNILNVHKILPYLCRSPHNATTPNWGNTLTCLRFYCLIRHYNDTLYLKHISFDIYCYYLLYLLMHVRGYTLIMSPPTP